MYNASYITTIILTIALTVNINELKAQDSTKKYLKSIKAKQVSDQLLGAEFSVQCAKKLNIKIVDEKLVFPEGQSVRDDYKKCVAQAIDDIDSKKIKSLSEKINLKAFDAEASESASSIKEYLQNRLHTKIYGKTPEEQELEKSFQDKGVIDHKLFFQLYSQQLGKNTFLHTSRYCLETFGVKGKKLDLFIPKLNQFTNVILESSDPNKKQIFEDMSIKSDVIDSLLKSYDPNSEVKLSGFWKSSTDMFIEYSTCTLPNISACKEKYGENFRHINQINLLKNAEFETAKDGNTDIINSRYQFCVAQAIPKMCTLYKCNNVYSSKSTSKDKESCLELGIDVETKTANLNSSTGIVKDNNQEASLNFITNTGKKTGVIACNIQDRLREYKIAMNQVEELEANYVKGNLKKSILEPYFYKMRELGKGADRINIDELTSVASNELTSGADVFSENEEKAENLKTDCMQENTLGEWVLKDDALSNKNCAPLIAQMDKQSLDQINLAEEVQSSVELKELELIEDEEGLKEFLKRNKMSDLINSNEELTPDKIKELKQKIGEDYKAKKLALVESLKDKFNKELQLDNSKDSNDQVMKQLKNDIALQTVSDIKEHQKRVENLVQYSNIVSSFITLKDKDSKKESKNSIGLNTELKNNSDDPNIKYFSGSSGESANANEKINYSSLIDSVLGIATEEQSTK